MLADFICILDWINYAFPADEECHAHVQRNCSIFMVRTEIVKVKEYVSTYVRLKSLEAAFII